MATIAKLIFYELVLRDMGGLHLQARPWIENTDRHSLLVNGMSDT